MNSEIDAIQAVRKSRQFACSYHHDGSDWAVTIHAYDWDDARARVAKLGFLRLDGEIMGKVPARLGVIAKLICWFRNRVTL